MGRNPKVNIEKLRDMVDEGKNQKECAEYFDCSIAAISKQMKKLRIAVVRHTAAKCAPSIVEKKFNQLQQLEKINKNANELLDLCMSWARGEDVAIQVLEAKIRKVNVGSKKDPKYVEKFKFKDPHEIALRAMQEIRGQLGLQLEIAKTLYDAEIVKQFMQEIVQLLADTDLELRNQFIQKVRSRAPLNFAVSNL